MKAISEEETAEAVLEMIQDSFELYELGYLSEESLCMPCSSDLLHLYNLSQDARMTERKLCVTNVYMM